MARTRSRLTSETLLNPSSSSRRRFFSADFATVLDSDLLDSRIRRPANQNSYHQMSPRWKRLTAHPYEDPTDCEVQILLYHRNATSRSMCGCGAPRVSSP